MNPFRNTLHRIGMRASRFVQRYEGFKFSLLIMSAIVSMMFVGYEAGNGPVRWCRLFISPTWLSFVLAYWASHLTLALILAVVLLSYGFLDILKEAFALRKPLEVRPPAQRRIDRRLRRMTKIICPAYLMLLLVTLPSLHLTIPTWGMLGSGVFSLVVSLCSIWSVRAPEASHKAFRRLGHFAFPQKSFDTASLGGQAMEVQEELNTYNRLRKSVPMNMLVNEYLKGGIPGADWAGVRGLFDRLSGYLGVSPQRLTFHETTTAAIRRALRLTEPLSCHLLTSDLEYPSVLNLATGLFQNRVTKIELRDEHLSGDLRAVDVVTRFTVAAESWFREHDSGWLLIIISHVIYVSGVMCDVGALRRSLARFDERLVFVVDGAQAVGNIDVTTDILNATDFYATSGHKWLLGRDTLGIRLFSTIRG